MKKKWLLLLLSAALALLLTACGQSPPKTLVTQPDADAVSIPAVPDAGAAYQTKRTLYFRYAGTGMLYAETRDITVSPNETLEKALVQALLDGPAFSGEQTAALFPKGTRVLSTQGQGDTLFVTFNEALYNRYPDEGGALGGLQARPEAALKRALAMAALTGTLTESGAYASVQVLVRPEAAVGDSMRLKAGYFLEDSELPCDRLTRREEYLPTPSNAAREIMAAWQTRDFERLYLYAASHDALGAPRPAQGSAAAAFGRSGALTAYAVSCGSVSPDGQSAIVLIDFTLRDESGREEAVSAWPLRLTREGGVWKADMTALQALMHIIAR